MERFPGKRIATRPRASLVRSVRDVNNHIQIDTNPMSPQPIPERSHP